MKLTRTEYDALIKRNPSLKPSQDGNKDTGKPPKPKQSVKDEPLETNGVKKGDTVTGFIIVTDCRKRLLDDDNLLEKFHIDALRYSKIIAQDSTRYYRIFTTQRKCTNQEEPHTLIEIY